MNRLLLIISLLLSAALPANAQTLAEMTVQDVPEGEGVSFIVRNASESILVVHSNIPVMTFEANMGIIKVDNPDPGEYRLHLHPGSSIITYKADGYMPVKQHIYIPIKDYREVRVIGGVILDELPVTVRLSPSNAAVKIDGEAIDLAGAVKLTVGEHDISASLAGYEPLAETFTVSENAVYFEYTLEKPKLCVVEVSTEPGGAEVYIDNVKMLGTTPISDVYDSGVYPIRITKEKYLPVEETIVIDRSLAKNHFTYKLEANFGLLSINTTDGAQVLLNGAQLDSLKNIELSPQAVSIHIEKSKCVSRDTTLIIRKDSNEIVDLYLLEQVGTIAISVDPPNAQIDLNGDAGEHFTSTGTKIFESVPIGSYELGVSLKGYKTDKRTLRLRPDETLRERITLEEGGGGEGPLSGMVFVEIPGGSFLMGSPSNESGRDNDENQHRVTLSGFQMMTTEVTQGMWETVMGNNPSNWKGDNLPVEEVSWYDCQDFIKKLNQRDPGKNYRLPTESEWEYACRAGTTTRFYSGDRDSDLDRVAWYDGNSGSRTHPIGQKQANAWGLYDMHGNVWEWCQDWYGDYPSGSVTDPRGTETRSYPVYRGGSWSNSAVYCRSAFRSNFVPSYRNNILGFRLVRDAGK